MRWSWWGDPAVLILLWDDYLLELVWWPMIAVTQVKVKYFELEKSYIEYGWWMSHEHIQKSCRYDWPFFLQGRENCLQLIMLILWIDLKQWTYWLAIDDGTNERHTLLLAGNMVRALLWNEYNDNEFTSWSILSYCSCLWRTKEWIKVLWLVQVVINMIGFILSTWTSASLIGINVWLCNKLEGLVTHHMI